MVLENNFDSWNDIWAGRWNDVCWERTSRHVSTTTITGLLIEFLSCLTKSLMIPKMKQIVNSILTDMLKRSCYIRFTTSATELC